MTQMYTPFLLCLMVISNLMLSSFTMMVWNYQGVGNQVFLNTMKELIRRYNPCILALLETKVSGVTADKVCRSISFDGVHRFEAQGFRGGIWVLWRMDELDLQLIKSSHQFITMKVQRRHENPWMFTTVYASPNESVRQSLRLELNAFGQLCDVPWLMAGDFNETRTMEERCNCSVELARRCTKFNAWIESNFLIDLGFSRPRFTWTRGTSVTTRKYTRLDRGLCNNIWRLMFEEANVQHVLQTKSDHSPLLISPYGSPMLQSTLRPFRFQAAWLSHTLFNDCLVVNWRQDIPLYPLLFHVSKALAEWNRDVFGNLFHKKKELWCRLEGIQRSWPHTHNRFLIKLEARLCTELDEVLDRIETLWFQKSRAEAIRDGDRNTQFYHLSTIIRRRNKIEMLQDQQGNWIVDRDELQALVRNFFLDIFTDGNPPYEPFLLPTNHYPNLTAAELDRLARGFTSCEIKKALFDI